MKQYMKLWKMIALTMAITLLAAILIYDSIREGQTMYYYSDVESGANWLEVDLDWGDSTDSLSLTIYAPNGSNIRTYYDANDEIVDGRIHLDIVPNQGYVEPGQWKFVWSTCHLS